MPRYIVDAHGYPAATIRRKTAALAALEYAIQQDLPPSSYVSVSTDTETRLFELTIQIRQFAQFSTEPVRKPVRRRNQ